MTLMGSALTLPGIAGLVLGIAMAVDANVLIYERIREELRAGKTPIAAIDAGFTRAFITIADSQLTTLACAAVMFWLGSGPIRGFAVTLTHRHLHLDLRLRHRGAAAHLLLAALGRPRRAGPSKCRSEVKAPMETSSPTSKASTSSRTTCGCRSCATRGWAWRCRSSPCCCRWRVLHAGSQLRRRLQGRLDASRCSRRAGPADIGQLRDKLNKLGLGAVQIQSFGAPDRRADPRRAAAGRRRRAAGRAARK